MEEDLVDANNSFSSGTAGKEIVVVTGGNGLIGSRVVQRLAPHYRIVILERKPTELAVKEAEFINFDITKDDSVNAALERIRYAYGNKIASVIHLAAYYDFSGEPSPLYEEVTEKGTGRLLTALQGFDVSQFVFSSTNLIYKPSRPGVKINEDCPLEGNWDYPESKINTEKLISEKRGAMKAVMLRIAGVYTGDGNSIPISHQIQRIYERQLIGHFYSGDLSHGNVFVHLDDLISAIAKTVEKRHSLPDEIPINIGEPKTPSYKELQEHIGKLIHGEEWQTYEMPAPLAKLGARAMNLFGDSFIKPWMIDRADDHFELDIGRAKQLLGWEPQKDLMSTLPEIIRKLKEDPDKWYEINKLNKGA